MTAAVRVIATQGLGAATATIAQEAGVSNGSLFNYFSTKVDLLNQLYVDLKIEMAAAALHGLPTERDIREQVRSMWTHWLHWATAFPDKRRTLAQLDVSDIITAESHQIASDALADVRTLLDRSRAHGPMGNAPLDFIVALMSGLTNATIAFMIDDPDNAETHCMAGFEALWRIVA
ncbi:MAG: TetR/AcrR family transcriptional regulator [Chloroflexota bacterium]